MKKVTWITEAYKRTSIHWVKSQASIIKMLQQLGIDQIRFTTVPSRLVFEFMTNFDEKNAPKAVRIFVPLRVTKDDTPDKRNQELNMMHRLLLNHLKAKFVAIGNGLTEFEQEFMSHLVITDKSGKSTTMGEALLPQYEKNLEDKTVPKFLLDDGN